RALARTACGSARADDAYGVKRGDTLEPGIVIPNQNGLVQTKKRRQRRLFADWIEWWAVIQSNCSPKRSNCADVAFSPPSVTVKVTVNRCVLDADQAGFDACYVAQKPSSM
ncbi:hypothetical protein VDF32_21220, partial [Xanthomonas campestris pv. raphani]|nr:hypothetical protein [Xanthomonas campestris pv. raphani]